LLHVGWGRDAPKTVLSAWRRDELFGFAAAALYQPINTIADHKEWEAGAGVNAGGAPTIAQAEVHVEGTLAAVHVTTDKDAIPDVLSAFETPFNLRNHTSGVRLVSV
jgi:hypothetical protein